MVNYLEVSNGKKKHWSIDDRELYTRHNYILSSCFQVQVYTMYARRKTSCSWHRERGFFYALLCVPSIWEPEQRIIIMLYDYAIHFGLTNRTWYANIVSYTFLSCFILFWTFNKKYKLLFVKYYLWHTRSKYQLWASTIRQHVIKNTIIWGRFCDLWYFCGWLFTGNITLYDNTRFDFDRVYAHYEVHNLNCKIWFWFVCIYNVFFKYCFSLTYFLLDLL